MYGEHVHIKTRVQALAHCVKSWEAGLDRLRRSVPPYYWLLFLGRGKEQKQLYSTSPLIAMPHEIQFGHVFIEIFPVSEFMDLFSKQAIR